MNSNLLFSTLLILFVSPLQAEESSPLPVGAATTEANESSIVGQATTVTEATLAEESKTEEAATVESANTEAATAPSPEPYEAPVEEIHYDQFNTMFGVPGEIEKPRWREKEYDPQPADELSRADELILPMPCAGAMLLRRIEVGDAEGFLGEQRIQLGSPSDIDAPRDYRHSTTLSGSFTAESGQAKDKRYYYLGKYEVTELQYQAVMGACPGVKQGRLPQSGISWFDAVDFTRRYSEWLLQNAPERLPEEDGARAYLRLPTEVEWEFAARGGLKVDSEAFNRALFPMGDDELKNYAWIRESVSSSFRPRPVGSLKANPLGLYDILGNVAELTFDLYRLNSGRQPHGQTGGFLVKGGHFRSWANGLSSSWRKEHPHFNPATGRANHLDSVGFRVSLTVPVLTSERRLNMIRRAWESRPAESAATANNSGLCRDLVDDVRSSLSAIQISLHQCLQAKGTLDLPVFPEAPQNSLKAPVKLPEWKEMLSRVGEMQADKTRNYGIWFLQANDPDKALLLFKSAVKGGDSWSALAIGAFYDPLLFKSRDPQTPPSPFSRANPEMALCWYRVAEKLGDDSAAVRINRVYEGQGDRPESRLPPKGCEVILEQYASP